MNQISDAGRVGDEANKIRQRPCDRVRVTQCSLPACSAGLTRLSRLEAGYSDCIASYKTFSTAGPDPPGLARPDFCQKFYSPARPDRAARPVQSSSFYRSHSLGLCQV